MWRNVLVVAPHPDDEILGCGGVIAKTATGGGRVWVCIVTRGAAALFADEVIEQGRAEAQAVHRDLGVAGTTFLDFPAPMLDTVAKHRITDALHALVMEQGSDTVLLPHPGDVHHDHGAVHQSALVACRPLGDSPVRRIYAYETLSETEWAPPRPDTWFIPTCYVDIAAFLDAKIAALRGYASQIKQAPHPRSVEGITALARVRGATIGRAAAEAFAVIREIRD